MASDDARYMADGATPDSDAANDIPDATERPVMQAQVVLDRIGFGPGVIDGIEQAYYYLQHGAGGQDFTQIFCPHTDLARAGKGFGAPGTVRISIGTREENERVLAVLIEGHTSRGP